MKTSLKRIFILAAAISVAACGGKDNTTGGGGGNTPTTAFVRTLDVEMVARLDGTELFASVSDATAIAAYGKRKNRVLDRVDSGSITRMNEVTFTNGWWLAYNPGKQVSATAFQGSVIALAQPVRDAHSLATGNTWFTYFAPALKGTVKKVDSNGTVLSTNTLDYTPNVYTGRLDSQEQVNAFGSTFTAMVAEHPDALVIGTVSNALYESLSGKVTASGGKAYVGKAGSLFTLFVAARAASWDFNEVKEAAIAGTSAKSYSVNVSWK